MQKGCIMRMRMTLVLVAGFALVGFGFVYSILPLGRAALAAVANEPTLARSSSQSAPVAQTVPASTAGPRSDKDGTTTVLSDDFSHKVVVEWSHSQTSRTPHGGQPFLGEFGPEVVTLDFERAAAAQIGAHQF